jgi:hypothetical protein
MRNPPVGHAASQSGRSWGEPPKAGGARRSIQRAPPPPMLLTVTASWLCLTCMPQHALACSFKTNGLAHCTCKLAARVHAAMACVEHAIVGADFAGYDKLCHEAVQLLKARPGAD